MREKGVRCCCCFLAVQSEKYEFWLFRFKHAPGTFNLGLGRGSGGQIVLRFWTFR